MFDTRLKKERENDYKKVKISFSMIFGILIKLKGKIINKNKEKIK